MMDEEREQEVAATMVVRRSWAVATVWARKRWREERKTMRWPSCSATTTKLVAADGTRMTTGAQSVAGTWKATVTAMVQRTEEVTTQVIHSTKRRERWSGTDTVATSMKRTLCGSERV